MDFFSFLTMIGGLALFLYGMNVLGDGLSRASGGRLERILEKITSNPLKAVLLGAGVTAVIQSSSATTVMVVGFVNSGIMKLSQAIGVIMGANIGTTVTSWILSLTGIESSSFFIRLLKPSSFSPILAIIGIFLIMMSKKDKQRDIGTIMIGFAVLMFGMETMNDAVKPLASVPEFTNILIAFSNPILGLLAGALLTAIIQSSSASVGILQALCASGAVSFGTAIPIIMGQNIGTCVTAMISSIGASKNAKRAAIVHLYFNIIGTIVFMLIFYSINAFIHFSFLSDTANAAGIAVVHSAFNVVATLVLLPFAKGLEKLACLTIKEETHPETGEMETHIQLLESRFLDTPSLAVEQSKHAAVEMAVFAQESLREAMGLIQNYDKKNAKKVLALEEKVDQYEDELGTYLVKLSSRDLSVKDSKTLSILLHCIGDFERISDHAVNIMEASKEMQDKELEFSKKALNEITIFSNAVDDIMNTAVKVFANEDLTMARSVEPLEEVIDYLNAELKARHIKRLRKGKCTIEMGFVLSDISTSFERIADHCSNIAVCVLQVTHDEFDTHEYMEILKKPENHEFEKQVEDFRQKYLLP